MQSSDYYRNCLETEVLAANPVELVRMLYRAALDSVDRARVCLREGDIAGRGHAIGRCSAILAELALSLDVNRGGSISRSLAELYDYTQRLLSDANIRQVDPPLAEARELLSTLLEGWVNCESQEVEAPLGTALLPPPVCDPVQTYGPAACTY